MNVYSHKQEIGLGLRNVKNDVSVLTFTVKAWLGNLVISPPLQSLLISMFLPPTPALKKALLIK